MILGGDPLGSVPLGATAETRVSTPQDMNLTVDPPYDSTAWTGASRPAARLIAVKTLLPVANAAIEELILSLDERGHNGGPPLNTTVEAINSLRSLHTVLGQIIEAADNGAIDAAYHDGMVSEACRYAKRAATKLRDDPMPYAMSAMVLAVLSACGFPGLGGFLSGFAANIQKK